MLTIAETSPLEEQPSQMELKVPGQDASGREVSDTNSDQSEASWKTVTKKSMPEVSLTSKRVREPEKGSKEQDNTVKKKERNNKGDTVEFSSCVEHLRAVVEELESSNFKNLGEVLGMEPSLHVEQAISTMIAMMGSTNPKDTIMTKCHEFYKEKKQIIQRNICLKDVHAELKREGSYSTFLNKVLLFRSTSIQQPH